MWPEGARRQLEISPSTQRLVWARSTSRRMVVTRPVTVRIWRGGWLGFCAGVDLGSVKRSVWRGLVRPARRLASVAGLSGGEDIGVESSSGRAVVAQAKSRSFDCVFALQRLRSG